MKAYRLYKIKQDIPYYLYVLQKKEYLDSLDILAIRSDFVPVILPLYSPSIVYEADLGYPTIQMLIDIDPSFYHAIVTAFHCCNLRFHGSALRENVGMYLKDNISTICYSNIARVQDRVRLNENSQMYHSLAAAINRVIGLGEVVTYVKDKIPTQTNN